MEIPTCVPRPKVFSVSRPQDRTTVPGAGRRILLVEDHADTAMIMVRLLKASGHTVKTASTVAFAEDLAAREPFDLVISDLGLPDGSGLDLMRHLKACFHLPGIALSGYSTEEDVQKSLEAGFEEHLTKPVEFNRLKEAIGRLEVSQS